MPRLVQYSMNTSVASCRCHNAARQKTRLSTSSSLARLTELRQARSDTPPVASQDQLDGHDDDDTAMGICNRKRHSEAHPDPSSAKRLRSDILHTQPHLPDSSLRNRASLRRTAPPASSLLETALPTEPFTPENGRSVDAASQPRTSGRARKTSRKAIEAQQLAAVPSATGTEKSRADPSRVRGERQSSLNGTLKTSNRILSSITSPSDPVPTNAIPFGHIAALQHAVLRKLHRYTPTHLIDLDDEYAKIAHLLAQTIERSESNSLLLVGARGSGKSALVDQAIRAARSQYGDEFYLVRLNGFLHTDAKLAFRETWKQLAKQMTDDDDAAPQTNIADILTKLLALMSHQDNDTTGKTATKGVIFILDEFDLFTTHPRQTLLYNLFDIVQSQKAPVAVIGLTTRLSSAETLEKRVRSRFSHRHMYIPLAIDFDRFSLMCRSCLELDMADIKLPVSSHSSLWNAAIQDLFDKRPALTTQLRHVYHTTKMVSDFQNLMLGPVCALSNLRPDDCKSLTPQAISEFLSETLALHAYRLLSPDNRLTMLTGLSTLQVSLLIAAARLNIMHDTDVVTFSLVYDEYKALTSKTRVESSASGQGVRLWSQMVAVKAWEGLRLSNFILPLNRSHLGAVTSGNAGNGQGNSSIDMCRVDVSLEEIGLELNNGGVDVDSLMIKWCKEGL